jgi:hypothetical protein
LSRLGKVKASGGVLVLSIEEYVRNTSWWAPCDERRLMIALNDLVLVGCGGSGSGGGGGLKGWKREGFSLFITHVRRHDMKESWLEITQSTGAAERHLKSKQNHKVQV